MAKAAIYVACLLAAFGGGVLAAYIFEWLRYRSWRRQRAANDDETWMRDMHLPPVIDRTSNPFWVNSVGDVHTERKPE